MTCATIADQKKTSFIPLVLRWPTKGKVNPVRNNRESFWKKKENVENSVELQIALLCRAFILYIFLFGAFILSYYGN